MLAVEIQIETLLDARQLRLAGEDVLQRTAVCEAQGGNFGRKRSRTGLAGRNQNRVAGRGFKSLDVGDIRLPLVPKADAPNRRNESGAVF